MTSTDHVVQDNGAITRTKDVVRSDLCRGTLVSHPGADDSGCVAVEFVVTDGTPGAIVEHLYSSLVRLSVLVHETHLEILAMRG